MPNSPGFPPGTERAEADMLAVGMREVNQPELIELPEPPMPSTDELLIDMEMVALSIAEVRAVRGDRFRHFGQKIDPSDPFIFGFAGVGRIRKSGSPSFAEGGRVILSGLVSCGKCSHCKRGLENHCEQMRLAGIDVGCPGYGRGQVLVPARLAHRIPDTFSPEKACVVSEVATGVHALRRGRLKAGESLGVIGSGRHGRQVIRLARRMGCRVVAIDPQESSRELALLAGAHEAIGPASASGLDLDCAIHANSDESSLALACNVTGPQGRVILLGTPAGKDVELPDPYALVSLPERELIGTDSKTAEGFRVAIEIMSTGEENWEVWNPRRVPIQEAPQALKTAAQSWPPSHDLFIDLSGSR
ncbi:MAG: alcohol dehydrogenase catalytic domain-containing protein [Rhizobiaceae bacterium]|nr:alcohol dehydrogenase catalytic domain-containing protein [Rhizobiaceae bacterium]